MRILFDQNMPRQIRLHLQKHSVATAPQMGWDRLVNGSLLRVAEAAGFDLMLTADQRMFYQQNNRERRIALVVLSSNHREPVLAQAAQIAEAVERAEPGSYELVTIERKRSKPWGYPSKL